MFSFFLFLVLNPQGLSTPTICRYRCVFGEAVRVFWYPPYPLPRLPTLTLVRTNLTTEESYGKSFTSLEAHRAPDRHFVMALAHPSTSPAPPARHPLHAHLPPHLLPPPSPRPHLLDQRSGSYLRPHSPLRHLRTAPPAAASSPTGRQD